MYADTPPLLLGVASSLLTDARGVAAVSWRIEAELRQRPVWVVVPPAPRLRRNDPETARELADDPSWDPPGAGNWHAAIVAHRLARGGVVLPLATVADLDAVPRRSALCPVDWDPLDAEGMAAMAESLGTRQVLVLAPGPSRRTDTGTHVVRFTDPREVALELA